MFDLTTIKNIVNQQYQKTQIEWHIFNIIDSTQKFLQNQLPTNHNNLQICIAKQQTASIGQKNKSWVSPNNTGLWFSIAMNNNYKVPWSLAVAKDIAMYKGRSDAWTDKLEMMLREAQDKMEAASEVNLSITGDRASLLNGAWRVRAGI